MLMMMMRGRGGGAVAGEASLRAGGHAPSVLKQEARRGVPAASGVAVAGGWRWRGMWRATAHFTPDYLHGFPASLITELLGNFKDRTPPYHPCLSFSHGLSLSLYCVLLVLAVKGTLSVEELTMSVPSTCTSGTSRYSTPLWVMFQANISMQHPSRQFSAALCALPSDDPAQKVLIVALLGLQLEPRRGLIHRL